MGAQLPIMQGKLVGLTCKTRHPWVYRYPASDTLSFSETRMSISAMSILHWRCPVLSDRALHSALNLLPIFSSLAKGFALVKALMKNVSQQGVPDRQRPLPPARIRVSTPFPTLFVPLLITWDTVYQCVYGHMSYYLLMNLIFSRWELASDSPFRPPWYQDWCLTHKWIQRSWFLRFSIICVFFSLQSGHQRVMTDPKISLPVSLLLLCCLWLPLTRSHFVELLLCLRPRKWGKFIVAARPGHRWVLAWT